MSSRDITAPGRELYARFTALGDMTNKTAEEIIASVGRPTSITSMPSGQTLLQWQATGCHMALLFGADGRFVKITHQYAAFATAPTGCMRFVVLAVALAVVSFASGP
jgi:hypothetical protein